LRETETSRTLRAETGGAKLIAWTWLLLCAIGTVAGMLTGEWSVALLGLPLTGCGIFLVTLTGRVETNTEMLTYVTPRGRFQMRWEEVTRWEAYSGNMVVGGEEKWIALPEPNLWTGAERKEVAAFLKEQLHRFRSVL
jgi:hypothetical protein